ncbi:Cyclic nucleotide-gated potassium channel [Rubripirellula obstinata]|uniref:Cyclic nucleotide-gated potassium channel n=1 Tax=Rubripirellula obstinata TaxID=406547 RepID=A0A5B1CC75_9BACT|nr:ion transporter [Rubripirellula obstinata]KAA1258737.1 Cyclic nucleotide-gated potassium channel [Rubripirellula obstinata]
MSINAKNPRKRDQQRPLKEGWRQRWYDIIFEADSPWGRWFDIAILIAILLSIGIVSLESVPEYIGNSKLLMCEVFLTGLFTVEYMLRLICVRHPLRYAVSFWGIIDLLSFLPTYITPFLGRSSQSFVIVRSIRLLRVFRVLKLWRMMNDADELSTAIWRARNKVVVFLCVVLVAVTISGTLMYQIETISSNPAHENGIDPNSQFTSIPQSMYWAIVTMTTVGYGDVVPQTNIGKVISAALILLGYSLIIVPSTFVSAEIVNKKVEDSGLQCPVCDATHHQKDATYCYRCGGKFD